MTRDQCGLVPGATLHLRSQRDFRRLCLGSAIAALGDYFRLFAIPLLVFSLTGSALGTGASLAAETLPYLVVSPFAGVLTDRVSRRRVMTGAQVAKVLLIGSLPAAYYARALSLPQIFAVGFAAGGADVAFGAASLSALPSLVPPGRLVAANSALQLSFSVCSLTGPPLAGVVVAATGQPAAALAADAAVQLLAACVIAAIRRPMPSGRPGPAAPVLTDIRQGLRYLWQHPLLRISALLLFTFNLILGGVLGQLVVFGRVVLGLHSLPLSLLYSSEGAGAVAGSLLAGPLGRRWPLGRIVLVALPAAAASVLVLSLSPDLAVAGVSLAVMGVAETVIFVNLIALRQRIVPSHLQGRVNATGRALAVSGTPAGALLAGALVAPLGGLRPALAVLGGLGVINAAATLFTPLRSDRTMTSQASHSPGSTTPPG